MAMSRTISPKESAGNSPAPVGGIAGALAKYKVRAKKLDDDADWYKILGYGDWGSGKTMAIVGFLQAGLKVLVIEVDFGGTGLRTVKEALRALGRLDLLKNIRFVPIDKYKVLYEVVKNPSLIEVESDADPNKLVSIYDWDPDMLVLEGLSNLQMNLVDEHILELESISKDPSEMREEGLVAELKDWDAVRRATMRTVNHFLNIHKPDPDPSVKTPAKYYSKYVTVLRSDPKNSSGEKDDNGRVKPGSAKSMPEGPLLQGASRKLIGSGFDLVIQMREVRAPGSKVARYVYQCASDGTMEAKRRGLPVDPIEDGDMEKLWYKITGQSEKLAALTAKTKGEKEAA